MTSVAPIVDPNRTVTEYDPDDSLCGDEFEMINHERGSPPTDSAMDSEAWSVHHSITMPPTVVNSLACSIIAHPVDGILQQSVTADSTLVDATKGETTPEGNTLTACGETPVMEGTISYPSVTGSPPHFQSFISILKAGDSSLLDDSPLASVRGPQAETMEILHKTLDTCRHISNEMTELKMDKKSLQSKLDDTNKKNEELLKENESMMKSYDQLKEEATRSCQALEQKVNTLLSQLEQQKTIPVLNLAKDGPVGPKENAQKVLEQQLYEKSLEVDSRDNSLRALREELEETKRKLMDRQGSGSSSGGSDKEKYLVQQLDVMCAKYLEERERRELAEFQLKNYRSENPSSMFTGSEINQHMVVEQLREKTKYVEQLEQEVTKLRKELEDSKANGDVGTLNEVINVLQEDRNEATRQLAEKDQKIEEFTKILEGLSRVQVDNC